MTHVSVLLQEVMDGLNPQAGEVVLDGTFGGGGHARELIKAIGKQGTYIGLDMDVAAIKRCDELAAYNITRVECVHANFRDADRVLDTLEIHTLDKVLLDIGLSSFQFEDSGRGFSFQKDEPLMMTFEETPGEGTMTAYDIVNHWDEENIATIIWKYGEDRFSRRIAKRIVEGRSEKPIERTSELVEIISSAVPKRFHGKINPATKTFQALRITVNDELQNLRIGLARLVDRLTSDGRIAVIAFHSLEDRIVKQFFKEMQEAGYGTILTKKPIIPTEEEIANNPRSRSAKLRIFQKA